MLVTELRGRLLEERKRGRKPAVVILTEKDFNEILEDLTIKTDVFDPIVLFGVQIVIDSQILRLTENPETTGVKGFTA
jgi:hypothetical protein